MLLEKYVFFICSIDTCHFDRISNSPTTLEVAKGDTHPPTSHPQLDRRRLVWSLGWLPFLCGHVRKKKTCHFYKMSDSLTTLKVVKGGMSARSLRLAPPLGWLPNPKKRKSIFLVLYIFINSDICFYFIDANMTFNRICQMF